MCQGDPCHRSNDMCSFFVPKSLSLGKQSLLKDISQEIAEYLYTDLLLFSLPPSHYTIVLETERVNLVLHLPPLRE